MMADKTTPLDAICYSGAEMKSAASEMQMRARELRHIADQLDRQAGEMLKASEQILPIRDDLMRAELSA